LFNESGGRVDYSYIIVLVTTASKQEAEKITQSLLEAKLIACANIVGSVASHFHWAGKIEHAEEFLVLMKSRSDLFEQIAEKVKRLHSYEVPEIIALPIVSGSEEYLGWLGKSLK
jgi:periplasmic divalent cation tolerance protein